MGQSGPGFESLRELLRWCLTAPAGTMLSAATVAAVLEGIGTTEDSQGPREGEDHPQIDAESWAERIWLVPAERRLNTAETLEALGRGKSWLFERLKGSDAIPHRKMDGQLVFTAGELRAWIRAHEEPLVAGPMESAPGERRVRVS